MMGQGTCILQVDLPDCEARPEEFEDSAENINGCSEQPALTDAVLIKPPEGTNMDGSTGIPRSTPGDKGETMTAEQAEALLQVFSNPLYSARQPTQTL